MITLFQFALTLSLCVRENKVNSLSAVSRHIEEKILELSESTRETKGEIP